MNPLILTFLSVIKPIPNKLLSSRAYVRFNLIKQIYIVETLIENFVEK